jgi:hypothetical protein
LTNVKKWVSLMMMRTLSKALLLVTISVGVPSLAGPASAAARTVHGRKNHHHRHHQRRRERHHEARENHAPDGERHGEL